MDIKDIFKKLFAYGLIFIMIEIAFVPQALSNLKNETEPGDFNGNILYTPEYSTKTYLINYDGDIINSWNCENIQGLAVYMLENGDILRTDSPFLNPRFLGGGVTGRVARYNWQGGREWEFIYSNSQHCLHHDIEPLPNGNVLMLVWEYKSNQEAVEQGRNPDTVITGLWPEIVIEVEPTGTTGGNIVWEWHVWDHLIQDYDSMKENYGVIDENPYRIDINYDENPLQYTPDWLHLNSIDYNQEFDQILLSVKHFNEIWVIDHSTTTEEAAGHTGGNSGKGGDILYRWGNPHAYQRGDYDDRRLYYQHDARWIEPGCPGEGNILIFDNGLFRPEGEYSMLVEIAPPVDSNGHYQLESDSSFGPEFPIWTYKTDFIATSMSGAQRLQNGNTIFCDGPAGKFYEINTDKEIIWEYENPYPNTIQNNVFKIQHYPIAEADLDCQGHLNWINIKSGEQITGEFVVKNIGGSGTTLNWNIKSYPGWGSWTFNPEAGEDLSPEDGSINVLVSVIAPDEVDKKFEGNIVVENQENPDDTDIIPVVLKTSRYRGVTPPFLDHFKHQFKLFSLLKLLLQIF